VARIRFQLTTLEIPFHGRLVSVHDSGKVDRSERGLGLNRRRIVLSRLETSELNFLPTACSIFESGREVTVL